MCSAGCAPLAITTLAGRYSSPNRSANKTATASHSSDTPSDGG